MFKKITDKASEIVGDTVQSAGQLTGNAIRKTVKGTYMGLSGQTQEDLDDAKVRTHNLNLNIQRNRRIQNRQSNINDWVFRVCIGACLALTLHLMKDSGYNTESLKSTLVNGWMYYAVIISIALTLSTFSGKFSESLEK